MNKNKTAGTLLAVLGAILLVGGLYLAISYMGTLMKGIIDFLSANSGEISDCGIGVPDMFIELKDQFATLILPVLYLGIPLAVVIISVIMFLGGYYYGKGSFQDRLKQEMEHEEKIEQEVERRVGKKSMKGKKQKEEPEEEE